jgi:hypothetical protein
MNRADILQKLAAGEISVAQATALLEATPEAGDQASDPDGGDTDPQRAAVGADAPSPEMNTQDNTDDLSANRAGMQTEEGKHTTVHRTNTKRKLLIDVVESDRTKVHVVLPFGLLRAGFWLGSKFSNRFPHNAWEAMVDALEEEDRWTLVHVEDGRDKVHIYVE